MSRVEIQPDQVLNVAVHIQSYGTEIKNMARELGNLFQNGVSPDLRSHLKGQFEDITARLCQVGNTLECLGSRTKEMARALIQLDQGIARDVRSHPDGSPGDSSPSSDMEMVRTGERQFESPTTVEGRFSPDGRLMQPGMVIDGNEPGGNTGQDSDIDIRPVLSERGASDTPGHHTVHVVEKVTLPGDMHGYVHPPGFTQPPGFEQPPQAARVAPLAQNNSLSCGQTSVAMCINSLTGKNLTDADIDARYGFGLLDALNAETRDVGVTWKDGGNICHDRWSLIDQKVNHEGTPVIVGLNGPEFSPSGKGHIVTIYRTEGDNVFFADPATGQMRTTTKQVMENAPSHPDGNFVFYAAEKPNQEGT